MKTLELTRKLGQLSANDRKVLRLVLNGYENLAIERELQMSCRTVKNRLGRMFIRFGIIDGRKRVKLAAMIFPVRGQI